MSDENSQDILLAVKGLSWLVGILGTVLIVMLGWFLNNLDTDIKVVKADTIRLKAQYMNLDNQLGKFDVKFDVKFDKFDARIIKLEDRY